MLDDVRPQLGVELLVAPLAGEVQVHLAERRQEAVRVADGERPVLAVVDLELVGERQLGTLDRALEDARRVNRGERGALSLGRDGGDCARGRPERADHGTALAVRMRAEVGVRIGRAAGGQLLGVCHVRSSSR